MYPLKATAAQVLGFAGTENKGLAGIELLYDKELSGEAGSETIVRDPAGHALKTVAHQEPTSGQNVRLTLDSQIQYYAEDVLEKTVRDTGGTSAISIVMDPRTGEILAMANVTQRRVPRLRQGRSVGREEPRGHRRLRARLDLQARHHLRRPGRRHRDAGHEVHARRRASTWPTARSTTSQPRGTVDYSVTRDPPAVEQRGRRHDRHARWAKDGLAKWIKAYGFGKPTGIEFPGEAGGIVVPVDQWSDSSIGNIPMGQGIAVTAIQMAVGLLDGRQQRLAVKPRLVAQVGTKVYDTVARSTA